MEKCAEKSMRGIHTNTHLLDSASKIALDYVLRSMACLQERLELFVGHSRPQEAPCGPKLPLRALPRAPDAMLTTSVVFSGPKTAHSPKLWLAGTGKGPQMPQRHRFHHARRRFRTIFNSCWPHVGPGYVGSKRCPTSPGVQGCVAILRGGGRTKWGCEWTRCLQICVLPHIQHCGPILVPTS